MADTPAMARLRGGHYNTSDWNASTNPGGMGGDGHRYAMIPPKAPQTPTYPVMVNDMVAVADEVAASAATAATSANALSGSASAAQASATAAAGSASAAASSASAASGSATSAGNAATSAGNSASAASGSATSAANSATAASGSATAAANSATSASGSASAAATSATSASGSASAASGSASAAAASASSAATALSNAQALLSNATLDGSSNSSTSVSVDTAAKTLTVATNKAFNVNHMIQVTRVSSPTTWLRGTVTAYNAGTGALSFTPTSVNAPGGTGPFTDWTVSIIGGANGAGDAASVTMTGPLTLTSISPRVQALDPNGASRNVLLPAANLMPGAGGPLFIIRNAMVETGALYVLDIRDNAGTFLRSLYPGDVAYVSLLSRANAIGTWDIVVINRDEGGAAVNVTMSGDLVLDRSIYRSKVFHLAPTDANRSVTLPAATSVEFLGGPLWYIRNAATSFPLTVKNNAGTVLARLSPQQTAVISCYNRSSVAGGWAVDVISNDPNGGVGNVSLTADFNMSAWGPRTLRCTPDAANRSINLPDATTYATAGGPVAYIVNHSASYGITLRTSGGTMSLVGIGPGQMATVHLLDRGSPQGTWFVVLDNFGVSSPGTGTLNTSMRQALFANGNTWNHKLSATQTPYKALWSYCNGAGSLCARILTITGQNVTAGAENVLASINANGAGQAMALSDAFGIAVYSNGSDLYSQGISINLSTGAVALAGSANGWGAGGSSFEDIRMDKVPGNNACIVQGRKSTGGDSYIRLVAYNGSTLTSSVTATGTPIEMQGRHDIVAVSPTEARQYVRYVGRMYGRGITLSVPSMSVTVTASVDSGGDCTDIYATTADTTWTICQYQDGSAYGAYVRAWNGSSIGPQVTLSNNSAARHGATLMWNATSGVFLYADYNGLNRQLILQEFTLLPSSSPFILIDPGKRRVLNASAGLAWGNSAAVGGSSSHVAAALTLSPTSGLLLFNDEGNSNYPTIVVVERSL